MAGGMDSFGYERAFVVNVNWNANDRNWNVNTWNRNDNKWDEDRRVFSPETFSFLTPASRSQFSFAHPCASHQLPSLSIVVFQIVMHISWYLMRVLPTLSVLRISECRVW